MNLFRKALLVIGMLLTHASLAPAQNQGGSQLGLAPGVPYDGHGIDHVNLMSGTVAINIPLVSFPQRGSSSLSFSLSGNAAAWQERSLCSSSSCSFYYTNFSGVGITDDASLNTYTSGYTFRDGSGSYYFSPGYVITDSTGADHQLWIDANDNTRLHATDGSGFAAQLQQSATATQSSPFFDVIDRKGILTSTTYNSYQSPISTIRKDRDGNQITLSYSNYLVQNYIDTVGRTIAAPPPGAPYAYGYGLSSSTIGCPTVQQGLPPLKSFAWPVPGPNNSTVNYLACFTAIHVHSNFDNNNGDQTITYSGDAGEADQFTNVFSEFNGDVIVLQSLVLPSGKWWGFTYDAPYYASAQSNTIAYGDLNGILFPDGGSISYTYQNLPNFCGGSGDLEERRRVLASRTLTNAQGKAFSWFYSLQDGVVDSIGKPKTTITDPNDNQEVHTFDVTPGGSSTCVSREISVERYQGHATAATPLFRQITDYAPTVLGPEDFASIYGSNERSYWTSYSRVVNALSQTVTTYMNGTKVSTQTQSFDSGGLSLIAPFCYFANDGSEDPQKCNNAVNYHSNGTVMASAGLMAGTALADGSGAFLQNEQTVYKWLTDSSYKSGNLLDQPSQTVVLDSQGGVAAQTTYTYDESSRVSGASALPLGHVTTMTRLVDANTSTSSHTNWTTTGLVSSSEDGRGTKTTYTYDSGEGAFLPHTSSVAGQTTTTTHDINTGTPTSITDVNGQVTSAVYDSSGRLWAVREPSTPSNGYTSVYCYPALGVVITMRAQSTPLQLPTASTQCAASVGNSIQSTTVYDGVGHVITARGDSASTETNFTWDGLGNLSTRTQQHAAGSSAELITITYDGMNRPSLESLSDSPDTRQWHYSGLTTTSIDERGLANTTVSNALHQLVYVTDAAGALTSYTYNALGSLVSVIQTGLAGETARPSRTFTYDRLSRLLTSYNPESGTICYGTWSGGSVGSGVCQNGYDPNGNILAKTDARGVTTTYTYDALNRVTGKSASDNSFLPHVFTYDEPSQSNGVGRLTSAYVTNGPGQRYSYDTMGRLSDRAVCVPGNCNYSLGASATYNLAGQLSTSRNAYGLTTGISYDSAGRVSGITATLPNTTTPISLLSSAVYEPAGLQSASLGNGLREQYTYDQRLRVSTYSVGAATSQVTGGSAPYAIIDSAFNSGNQTASVPAGGMLEAHGWAVDQEDGSPVANVVILVDGKVLGQAALGVARPDVAAAYNRSDWTNSGWSFEGSIGALTPGTHTITIAAYDWSGNYSISPNSQVINVTSDNAPFGSLDGAVGAVNASSTVVAGGLVYSSGWAADVEDGAPVENVQLLLDGSYLGEAQLGGSRPDVVSAYGGNNRYLHSGWTFGGSVRNASTGAHTVSAVGYDSSGNGTQLGSTTINIVAETDTIQGAVDTVGNASNQSSQTIPQGGTVYVSGWAGQVNSSAGAPVSRVDIEIDGEFLGTAVLGDPRSDVANALNRPDWNNSGWHFVGTVNVGPGQHRITARAYTQSTGSVLIPIIQQNNTILVTVSMPPLPANAAPGATRYSYSLNYSPNGNVVNSGDSVTGSWGYTYDVLNRLTGALSASRGVSWTYDSFGNRLTQNATVGSAPQPTVSFAGNNKNRLDNVCYDAAGNTLDDGPCPQFGAHQYAYDADERLLSSNYGATVYMYDTDGNRVAKRNNGSYSSVYFYDVAGRLALETDGSLSVIRHNEIYMGNRPLATLQNQTNWYYTHANWLGTAAARTDANGALCQTLSSLPFGDASQINGSCAPNSAFYTGKERDAESGLDFFGARYYGNSMGRFMSPDWSDEPEAVPYASLRNPQTLNMYAYGLNNPISNRDFDGHSCDPDYSTTDSNGTITVHAGQCHNDGWGMLSLAGAVGHHFIPQSIYKQINPNSYAYQYARKFVTGKLKDNTVNRYDKVHRAYNRAIQRLLDRYKERTGRGLEDFKDGDFKEVAKEIEGAEGDAKVFIDRMETSDPAVKTAVEAAEDAFQSVKNSPEAKALEQAGATAVEDGIIPPP